MRFNVAFALIEMWVIYYDFDSDNMLEFEVEYTVLCTVYP